MIEDSSAEGDQRLSVSADESVIMVGAAHPGEPTTASRRTVVR